jgi:anti-sigma-K factor RskA
MTKNQIQESGLLELYVLAELAPDEMRMIAAAIEQYPDLREECREIEIAYKYYADSHAVQPNKDLIDKVINKISNSNKAKSQPIETTKKKSFNFWIPLFLAALGCCLWNLWKISNYNKEKTSLEKKVRDCEEEQKATQTKYAIYDQLNDPNNRIIEIEATEKYPQTQLYLYTNAVAGKNYIQVQNLPPISANQSYQLWSLRGDNPPTPMDVFQVEDNQIFEVAYVFNTDTYAITIEDRGGKESPNLENLIGIIKVSG